MIIKKYTAATETEAIMMAKEELGPNAIVMNMKTTKPRGFRKLFKKPSVEITAAIDENPVKKEVASKKDDNKKNDNVVTTQGQSASAIEERLDNLAFLLERKMADEVKKEKTNADNTSKECEKTEQSEEDKNKESESATLKKEKLSDLIYKQLRNNEVNEDYAKAIVADLSDKTEKSTLDDMLACVYQKIVLKLGENHIIKPLDDKVNVLFFVGPTGVGKTTTIAKLAAKCKLNQNLKVAFITADTYRIAAEEQLKTYAGIMNIPFEIVYTPEDMETKMDLFKDYDLVFVDTVGHSHKNKEQYDEVKALLECVPEEQRDVFLVLSATTKYNDLLRITKAYEGMTKYSLIFTKLDETSASGNILNLKLATKALLSYVAWGQNVPDDIGEVNAQEIAKQLLGGND